MADKTSTTFPKVGTVNARPVNQSGKSSPNTKPVARKGPTGAVESATAKHRSGKLERLGAKLHPQTTLYKANASEASATLRSVRTVPSALGNRDFWKKRSYGQGM